MASPSAAAASEAGAREAPRRDLRWTGLDVAALLLIAAAFFSGNDIVALASYTIAAGIGTCRFLLSGRMRWFGAWSLGFGVWWVVYAGAIGSLPSLEELGDFAGSEVRILLAGVPLIVMGMAANRAEAVGAVSRSFRVLGWMGPLLIILYVLTPDLVRGHGGTLLFGFTSSHHVSGFMFGVFLLIAVTQPSLYRSRSVQLFLIVSAAAVVLLSGSRTSLLGLLIATAAAVLAKRSISARTRRWVMMGAVVICVGLALFVPRATGTVASLARSDFREAANVALSTGDRELATSVGGDAALDANVLTRLALFNRAFELWTTSPLIGIGPFRFDDVNTDRVGSIDRVGASGVVFPVTSGDRTFTDAQAHNMVLHLLAEGGVVAVLLVVGLWATMAIRLVGRARQAPTSADASSCRTGFLVIVFALGVSIPSEGLLTPALAIPVGLMAGAAEVVRMEGSNSSSRAVTGYDGNGPEHD